jgi:hypothetical protein
MSRTLFGVPRVALSRDALYRIGLSATLALAALAAGIVSGPRPVSAQEPAAPAASPALASSPAPTPACTPETEPNEHPEQALKLSSAVCLTGELPLLRDQDLVLWTVEPAEALITWRVTIEGIPTTITSVYIFAIDSEPGTFPLDVRQLHRVDSSATDTTPGVQSGISLPAATYLLGISRGDPVGGVPAPPSEYRALIEREQPLPPNGDLEPNDDAATASPAGNPIALIGDAHGSPDLYRWTVSDEDAARTWQIDVRAVEGDYMALELRQEDGTPIARTDVPRNGQGHLYDLRIPAGTYYFAFSTTDDDATPYVLEVRPSDAADADPEPNDTVPQAIPIAIGGALPGRLAGPRDFDQYTLTVPQYEVPTLLDVGITVGTEQDRQVCLVRHPGANSVQCRQGRADIVLSNLSLEAGDYTIEVSGDEDLVDRYRLAVAEAGMVVADGEVEPNDDPATASAFDPGLVLRGRSANEDRDYYRITVAGEPQVWRLDATGTGIQELLWVEPDLEIRGTGDVSADGTHASVWDLALVPGDHWISIRASGEDYQLALTPLGPRAAGAEREPNNDTNSAEPIEIDVPRTGRLPGPSDTDVYRFSLEAPEQVTVRVEPPADGAPHVRILAGGLELMRVREPRPGVPIEYPASLPEGDVEIHLQSDSGSVQPYTVTVRRGDPFDESPDLEPNSTMAQARPAPADLVIAGSGYGGESGEDDDWFLLPPLEREATIEVAAEGELVSLELNDGTSGVRLTPGTDGTWVSSPVPADTTLRLNVISSGPYELTVRSDGLTPGSSPQPLRVDARLTTEIEEVAAYATVGQSVTGRLQVANTGTSPLSLAIEGVTTHYSWTIEPAAATIELAPGASEEMPITIHVPADAWADVPVRASLRLTGDDGRGVTASVDVTPRRDQPLVAPEEWWPVPPELLGGLDAASLALGATVPAPVNSSEPQLHDGVAMMSVGFSGSVPGDPQALSVDLATDQPVPVAGIILDPLAGTPAMATSPRRFELLLSDDGSTWEPVLEGELSPYGRAQPFVLPATVDARHAQLRIASTWAGPTGGYWLGEWQVIASPGWSPAPELNLAEPLNGGHITWVEPGATDPRQLDTIVSEDQTQTWEPYLQRGTIVSWALAFHDQRAAQLTRLEWVDPPGSDPKMRFHEVTVQVTTGSALGPWTDAGTWTLARAEDGSVAPFTFNQPTWARFVRFSGTGPAETAYWEMPVVLRAFERPIDGDYRSILGAWGRRSTRAVHELLEQPDTTALEQPVDLEDGNDTSETATVVEPGADPVDAWIRRGEDVDWYSMTVPEGMNRLEFELVAGPTAGLEPTLHVSSGAAVELEPISADTVDGSAWGADVEPGATYRLRVEQLPFSTVFTYDTSGSMGRYVSYVTAALRGFAADITPGEEAALVMPFEDPPLLDTWSDDPYALETAVAGVASVSGSSAAERSLIAASRELALRKGPRAILLVTDAETSSYPEMGSLWGYLQDVRPIIFAVHVEGGGAPALTSDLMQDWAASGGGFYEYAVSHGQVDRAFDRLATWLRRPAAYTVSWRATFESREPGSLSVSAPVGPQGRGSFVAGSGVAVEVILDTSGSMLDRVGKRRRIDIAKAVLTDLVRTGLPKGVPVALRVFGDQRDVCGTRLAVPLAPLDPSAVTRLVRGIRVVREADTPIAGAISAVPTDLAGNARTRIVLMITDAEEVWPHRDLCGRDPAGAIEALRGAGIEVRLDIVGFGMSNRRAKAQMRRWAELGGGSYFDAGDQRELAEGIAVALRAPFQVFDEDGLLAATGTVDGPEVVLPPGRYRVEVLTSPVIVLEDVEILAGEGRDIELEQPTPDG